MERARLPARIHTGYSPAGPGASELVILRPWRAYFTLSTLMEPSVRLPVRVTFLPADSLTLS